jgi:hypothetical protein
MEDFIMSEEISREALLIYLDDVRIMETIVYESKNKNEEVIRKKDSLKQEYYAFVEESEPDPPSKVVNIRREEREDDLQKEKPKIAGLSILLIACLIFTVMVFQSGGGFWGVLGCLIFFILPVGFFWFAEIYGYRDDRNALDHDIHRYHEAWKKYDKEKENYDVAMVKYRENCDKKEQELKEAYRVADTLIENVNTEKDTISEQLQTAYNANIIPLQFRNIQGIYYLYDYISTSNQGLSEALMQCNLEAIKDKLDNVIKLQGKSIVQQAQANAALYEQNQRILNSLQDLNAKTDNVVSNTFVAAKYAQISAINSAVALKMQSKQLAYQRADFWLK